MNRLEPSLNNIYMIQCCILVKQSDLSFTQCKKFAFKPLTKELIDAVAKKNLLFYFDNSHRHRLAICLSHRRLILNSNKFNDSYQKINISNYEVVEHKELQEFMFDFCVYLRESQEFLSTSNIPSSSNSDSMLANRLVVEKYENLWERYRSIEDDIERRNSISSVVEKLSNSDSADNYSNDCNGEIESLETQASSSTRNANNLKKFKDHRIPFSNLSAMTLRRCKKFFKLPNRSGTNSKSQLLEGINEYVEIIPVDQAETAAYFMYTLRNKKNVLDNPSDCSEDGLSSQKF